MVWSNVKIGLFLLGLKMEKPVMYSLWGLYTGIYTLTNVIK
jgi:hypothetical protein